MAQTNIESMQPEMSRSFSVSCEITSLLQGIILVPLLSSIEAIINDGIPYYTAIGTGAISLIAVAMARQDESASERRTLTRYATYYATGAFIGLMPQVHSLVERLGEYAFR